MMAGMRKNGVDPSVIEKRAKRLMAQKKAEWEAAGGDAQNDDAEDDGMDVDMESVATGTTAGKKAGGIQPRNGKLPKANRQLAGLGNRTQDIKATELRMFAQRLPNRLAKASESDRHVPITRPKWMLAGKRKNGKTDYR
jgi:nucleolar GTP-binding protein